MKLSSASSVDGGPWCQGSGFGSRRCIIVSPLTEFETKPRAANSRRRSGDIRPACSRLTNAMTTAAKGACAYLYLPPLTPCDAGFVSCRPHNCCMRSALPMSIPLLSRLSRLTNIRQSSVKVFHVVCSLEGSNPLERRLEGSRGRALNRSWTDFEACSSNGRGADLRHVMAGPRPTLS